MLHSVYRIYADLRRRDHGRQGSDKRDITHLTSDRKLKEARVAYILQDKSVFPNMTVEENLLMGGYLLHSHAKAKAAAERVFDKYDRLAARRHHAAKVLSGGERRLLEISRALVMEPDVLLVDEPSIGLEPRFIDMVFEILHDLQHREGKTILMVEQNAKKGLEFADIGYVLVFGRDWRWRHRAMSCCRIPTSAGCSWAADFSAVSAADLDRRARRHEFEQFHDVPVAHSNAADRPRLAHLGRIGRAVDVDVAPHGVDIAQPIEARLAAR